jgi:hypothetical protein
MAQLQEYLRQIPEYREAIVTRQDLIVTSANAAHATASQWAAVKDVQSLVPDATVTLRIHKISWTRSPQIVLAPVFGILVTQRIEPFTFRREYQAPV